jgi:hypothetical protein
MTHPAQLDHDLLVSEFLRAWRHDEPKLVGRVRLPDPLKDSGDVDIPYLSPRFVFGEQFDPSSDDDVAPFTAQQVAGGDDGTGTERPGVGYIVVRVGPDGPTLYPSSSSGDPGLYDRQVPFEARIFVPAVGGKGLATAYGCALAEIFSGAGWSAIGDTRSYCLVNVDHPAAGVTFVSSDNFTTEWRWQCTFIRTATSTISGPAPIPVMGPNGGVVLNPSGEPLYVGP